MDLRRAPFQTLPPWPYWGIFWPAVQGARDHSRSISGWLPNFQCLLPNFQSLPHRPYWSFLWAAVQTARGHSRINGSLAGSRPNFQSLRPGPYWGVSSPAVWESLGQKFMKKKEKEQDNGQNGLKTMDLVENGWQFQKISKKWGEYY